jgi:hypothetical protein
MKTTMMILLGRKLSVKKVLLLTKTKMKKIWKRPRKQCIIKLNIGNLGEDLPKRLELMLFKQMVCKPQRHQMI